MSDEKAHLSNYNMKSKQFTIFQISEYINKIAEIRSTMEFRLKFLFMMDSAYTKGHKQCT